LENVRSDEKLARFVFSKNHFKPSDRTVKYAAFMPPSQNKKTSVFCVSGLSEEEIWEIGNRDVAQIRQKPLLGRGDILVLHVQKTGLNVNIDNNPPRHANIIGWPEEHSAQILKAIELAKNAQLHLCPPP
jgi:hypothetical protein